MSFWRRPPTVAEFYGEEPRWTMFEWGFYGTLTVVAVVLLMVTT